MNVPLMVLSTTQVDAKGSSWELQHLNQSDIIFYQKDFSTFYFICSLKIKNVLFFLVILLDEGRVI